MFASLPWYDLPEVRPWTDTWWRVLRRPLRQAGLEAEEPLEREHAYEQQWRSDGLLLSQACGYDVRLAFAHRLQLVATPCYAASGCEGPRYTSHVVVADAPSLLLEGFVELPLEAFDGIADLHHFAEVQGYFELHPGLE